MRALVPILRALSVALVAGAHAQAKAGPLVETLPPGSLSLSEFFYAGQAVYDLEGNEIADVNDVILGRDGEVVAVILGVGGVLGVGEKNVAVSFGALETAQKDRKNILILDSPKSELERAPGFEYDRAKGQWLPAAARQLESQSEER
jgi:hypothetical protein